MVSVIERLSPVGSNSNYHTMQLFYDVFGAFQADPVSLVRYIIIRHMVGYNGATLDRVAAKLNEQLRGERL